MIKQSLYVGPLFALIAGTCAAQSINTLGKDNTAFARNLYRKGYPDLAEGVCRSLAEADKQGKADKDELIALQAMYLDLRLDSARRETDVLKRKDLIAGILKEKEEFVASHPKTAEADETRASLPDVYRALGETLIAAIDKETDLNNAANMRKDGQQAFDRAIESLEDQVERLDKMLKASEEEDPDVRFRHMDAFYNLARTLYFNSLLYPAGDTQKKVLLKKAENQFINFDLDYGQTLVKYEGLVYLGLAYKDLEKPADALSAFDDAIKLRTTYELRSDGKYAFDSDYAANIVSSGVLQKVLMLKQLKKFDEAVAECETFFATTERPFDTEKGLAVMAAECDVMLEKGDTVKAGELAQKLIDEDPAGPWGAFGGKVQADVLNIAPGGSGLGADKLLSVAGGLYQRKEYARALQVLAQTRAAAQGDKNEDDIGAEVMWLTGIIFQDQGNVFAAAIAYQSASEMYPEGEKSPEALSAATKAWRKLNNETKYPQLAKRIDETQARLLQQYPNHPTAAEVQLSEGLGFEAEREYAKAVTAFLKVKPESPVYRRAQVHAAENLFQQAVALVNREKRPLAEARPFLDQIEPLVSKLYPSLEADMGKTLNDQARGDMARTAWRARRILARAWFMIGEGKEAQVVKLLADVEERYAGFPDFVGEAWSLRIQAYERQGNVDRAIQLFDALVQKDPNSPAVVPAAGVLAKALDDKAFAERERDLNSTTADDLQRKAATYYKISVQRMLKGQDTIRGEKIIEAADRLYSFGREINRLPGSTVNFISWQPGPKFNGQYWEDCIPMYEAALTVTPSYEATIDLGRCYGFLSKWREAASVYARLFDQEHLVDPNNGKGINMGLAKVKPSLIPAYLEWGVTEHLGASADNDINRYQRAASIFELMSDAYKDSTDTALYWQAKYYQCKSLYDRGKYENADVALRAVERNVSKNFDGGKFGLQAAFEKLKSDLEPKVKK